MKGDRLLRDTNGDDRMNSRMVQKMFRPFRGSQFKNQAIDECNGDKAGGNQITQFCEGHFATFSNETEMSGETFNLVDEDAFFFHVRLTFNRDFIDVPTICG